MNTADLDLLVICRSSSSGLEAIRLQGPGDEGERCNFARGKARCISRLKICARQLGFRAYSFSSLGFRA